MADDGDGVVNGAGPPIPTKYSCRGSAVQYITVKTVRMIHNSAVSAKGNSDLQAQVNDLFYVVVEHSKKPIVDMIVPLSYHCCLQMTTLPQQAGTGTPATRP